MSFDYLQKARSSIEGASHRLISKIEARDNASIIARKIIKLCGEAISLTHRGRNAEARGKLNEAKLALSEIGVLMKDLGVDIFEVALQEYVEAESLLRIVEGRELPSIEELQVTDEAYILGLADLIGELRRRVLEEIRKGDGLRAEELYQVMRDLYEILWPLEYPRSLVPGLRSKIDAMRRVIDETLHDITLMKLMRS
ncbi:MAG: haloacid dehalogenase [Candidatus Nezhaarchaeota archaeon]|nr:haloacid dehalogenase [Candidatus Nezhaarchaeota archaeon]MCX8141187.1 haloacid dehalogenase [Candidatus Nezhaarchaeota archaeon]MDW8049453.1 haloacid dehalogenase [Nitrososphaerota archaeon]